MRLLYSLALAIAFIAAPLVAQGNQSDSSATLIPAGLGTLKQDAIALRFTSGNLEIRLTPLDEPIIRLLSPDAYQALSGLVTSNRTRIDSIASARGALQPGVALVAFFSATANTRFDPRQMIIVLPSRRMTPLGIIPLMPGFSNQQLDAREQVTGILVYDRRFPTTEAFQVQYLSTVNRDWEMILPRLQSERTRILGLTTKSSSDTTGTQP